jgi:hypothetical protein
LAHANIASEFFAAGRKSSPVAAACGVDLRLYDFRQPLDTASDSAVAPSNTGRRLFFATRVLGPMVTIAGASRLGIR